MPEDANCDSKVSFSSRLGILVEPFETGTDGSIAKKRYIFLKTGTNMKYNMGDNLINVSCAYPKGQGHGSHICVLQNT
jgi:hypothetical protein